MSMEGTLRMTKGEKMAMEMAHQLGGIAVRSGTGGMTLVTKAEAARRTLIDAERAKLDAAEKPTAEVVTEPAAVVKKERVSRKSAAVAVAEVLSEATQAVLAAQPALKAKATKKATAIVAQTTGITAVSGVAPGKGQLPAGLVAYLAKRAAEKAAGVKPAKKAKATAVAAGASERVSKRIAVCPHCGGKLG